MVVLLYPTGGHFPGPPLGAGLRTACLRSHGGQGLIQCQILEECFSLLCVVAVSCRELAQEANRGDNPQLFRQQLDGLLGDFVQGLCLNGHRATSAISSSGETALVGGRTTTFARFKNRSSHVQKKSAWP